MKVVLALDPGTRCGWAVRSACGAVHHGTWDLRSRRHEGGGMRFVRLERCLTEFEPKPDLIYYEEVRRHLGTDAAHVYGGIIATATQWAEHHRIPYAAVPVATIKRHATGKGNAGKDVVLAAARERFGAVETDDEADALFLLDYAVDELVPR